MPRKSQGVRIEPNKHCIYELRWTENGRSYRRTTRTGDFQEAQRILANFILLKDRDEAVAAKRRDLSVDEILDAYWREHVEPKVVSKETAGFIIKRLREFFGPMAAGSIMPDHVREYIARRRAGAFGKPAIDSTIERDLSVLRASINHAIKHRRLPPGDRPMIEKLQGSPPRDRWLTHAEADRLLAAAMESPAPKGKLPRVYKFISIALGTAARKSAILELTKKQVDLERGMIHLNPTGRAQTKKRRPAVPISDRLMPVMKRIVEEADGERLLGHGCIRSAFEGAASRAGLHDVTPHTLRHTWATWAAQAGVPLTDIAAVLGDTYATVEKNYLHHCPEHLRGAVNAVRSCA